jgi:hypothetical protein
MTIEDEPSSGGGGGGLALVRAPVSLEARAEVGIDVLRSPVTGQPCVYWRLRVVEHLTARSELVHEMASSEPFDLVWGDGHGRQPVRVRLDPGTARIEGTPSLHREGTPGALTVAGAYGFSGAISVEEVVIRPGDTLEADGILEDVSLGAGLLRTVANHLELIDATLRLPSRSLAPMLLPWALGTAAALLGGIGLVTWAAWRHHVRHLPLGAHAWRTIGVGAASSVGPAPRLSPPEPLRPRFP